MAEDVGKRTAVIREVIKSLRQPAEVPLPRYVQPPQDMSILESLMANIGLGTPVSRFMFGVGIGEALTFFLKPEFAFVRDKMRPWKLVTKDPKDEATWVPWWMPGILTGIVLSVFI
jgi:hypothetical protein